MSSDRPSDAPSGRSPDGQRNGGDNREVAEAEETGGGVVELFEEESEAGDGAGEMIEKERMAGKMLMKANNERMFYSQANP